ncbi:cytoglobin-1-like [Sinocyclocheilus rhinocerous]|uniref:superoxide dismutase n=1 Tax=Sinocyclocheilus rhinocerous TaxID=307959 RepID=A0A673IT48_9TELE|nr:PREDICTED: cytoglobin-1-like [Sinocyclocheilus rhinocerous]
MEGDGGVALTQSPETLTEDDVCVIQDTWRPVYENRENAGVAVLIRFFSNFPSAKQYFDQFRDMQDPEEMKESIQLKKHALRVMTALNTLVENLRDGDKLNTIFQQMGKSHALRHKVDPVYFKILAGVILEVLVEAFPQCFSPASVQSAWSKLLGVLYWQMNKVYAEVGWESIKNSAK